MEAYATPQEQNEQDQHDDDQGTSSVRDDYKAWPFGDGDDRPQPWDHRTLGIDPNDVGPGEPDHASAVPITHSYPILSGGSHGGAVLELGQLLGQAGYANSVTDGENPFNVLDTSLLRAVQQFRRDHGVVEDPTPFGGDNKQGQEAADNHVGPFTWEALQRVIDREAE